MQCTYTRLKEDGLIEWVAVVFWLVFTFLSAVVLMSQLVAMMGETYSEQKSHAAVTWMLLRADIMRSLGYGQTCGALASKEVT